MGFTGFRASAVVEKCSRPFPRGSYVRQSMLQTAKK